MKPYDHLARPPNSVPLSNFALFDKIPSRLTLSDYLMPFQGAKTHPDYLWALYGTSSMNRVLFLADSYANRHKKQLLTVLFWYHVNGFDKVKSKIDLEIAKESGFIHLDRLQADFRDQLRFHILQSLSATLAAPQVAVLNSLSLADIMVRHPEAVSLIFDLYKQVCVVVHPVLQLYDINDKRPVQIATVRKLKSRIMSAQVRYMEEQVLVDL